MTWDRLTSSCRVFGPCQETCTQRRQPSAHWCQSHLSIQIGLIGFSHRGWRSLGQHMTWFVSRICELTWLVRYCQQLGQCCRRSQYPWWWLQQRVHPCLTYRRCIQWSRNSSRLGLVPPPRFGFGFDFIVVDSISFNHHSHHQGVVVYNIILKSTTHRKIGDTNTNTNTYLASKTTSTVLSPTCLVRVMVISPSTSLNWNPDSLRKVSISSNWE